MMYDRRISTGEFIRIEDSVGQTADETRNYEIAFFYESSEFLKLIEITRKTLVREILRFLAVRVFLISFICFLLFIVMMRRTARKMTSQVIFLYETMEGI